MWPRFLQSLDATHASLEENLAYDVSLLDAAERDPSACVLRFWESSSYGVVVGRSNDIGREVRQTACQADEVPIVRRASGGGAVVIGPGCLCFSLVLPIPAELPQLGVSGVTRAVMQRLADALRAPAEIIQIQGISDLVLGDRKFAGNAQRWKRRAFLHHGTILYDFDLPRIARYLETPSRQPDYRGGRGHGEFVVNLRRSREDLMESLLHAWNSGEAEA